MHFKNTLNTTIYAGFRAFFTQFPAKFKGFLSYRERSFLYDKKRNEQPAWVITLYGKNPFLIINNKLFSQSCQSPILIFPKYAIGIFNATGEL